MCESPLCDDVSGVVGVHFTASVGVSQINGVVFRSVVRVVVLQLSRGASSVYGVPSTFALSPSV